MIAGRHVNNSFVSRRVAQDCGARLAALFDEYRRTAAGVLGLLGLFCGTRTGGQLVQPSPVLLGDVVERRHFANLVQHSPGVNITAQLDQRLDQAVHRFNVVGEQLQDGFVDLGGAQPLTLDGEIHRLFAEVFLQSYTGGSLHGFEVHPVSCPVLHAS